MPEPAPPPLPEPMYLKVLCVAAHLTEVYCFCRFRLVYMKAYIHSFIHGAEPFLRSCHLYSHSRTSQNFMEL
jgi:hypothetical protein